MLNSLTTHRKPILIACCLVLTLSAIVGARHKSSAQRAQDSLRKGALKLVNESPEQFLRILGNDDCPLRIVEAKVKEVPDSIFTELTGKTTKLGLVSSVPEVKLLNTSDQTISKFMLLVRDPKSRKTRGVIEHDVAVKPGDTFTINRELFITPDKLIVAGVKEPKLISPGLKSDKGWLEFAARPDLFVTVGLIEFADGSNWKLKEGGEVK
jgi:hypothetical protein